MKAEWTTCMKIICVLCNAVQVCHYFFICIAWVGKCKDGWTGMDRSKVMGPAFLSW